MTVRTIGADEAERAHALRLAALGSDPYAYGATLAEESGLDRSEIVERYAPSDDGFVLGAFDDTGELVGLVGFRRQRGEKRRHSGQVWGLYVDPEARGRGVARTLMTLLLQAVTQRKDIVQVTLGASDVAGPAKALYQSLGFGTYGIEPNAHRQDGRSFAMEFMVRTIEDVDGTTTATVSRSG